MGERTRARLVCFGLREKSVALGHCPESQTGAEARLARQPDLSHQNY